MLRASFLLLLLVTSLSAQSEKQGTASISGRVLRGEKPLVGVLVMASRRHSLGGWQPAGTVAKTDSDGRYRLKNLAAGNYLITPRALADVMPGSDVYNYGKPVLVQDGETVENVDFSLVKGGVITGTVTDENGKPVIAAEIRLLKKAERGPSQMYYSPHSYLMNKTDDRGVYRLFGLPPGNYMVRVGSEQDGTPLRNRVGGDYYPLTFHPDVTNEAEAAVIEVTEGNTHKNIDIKLPKAASTYAMKGRIVDAVTGVPIVGVRFSIMRLSGSGGGIGFSGLERANLQGEFQISGFSPGRYQISQAMEEGVNYYSAPKEVEVVNSDVTGIELKATQGSTLMGRVIIEGTKDPMLTSVKNIQLNLSSESSERSSARRHVRVTVNPDGSFRVVGLSPGNASFHLGIVGNVLPSPRSFILRTEKDGQSYPDKFPVTANENAMNVRVVVAYGVGVVRGQVKVIGGELSDVGPMRVWLVPQSSSQPRSNHSAMTDASGRFLLEGLLSGSYQLRVSPVHPEPAGKRRKLPAPQPVTVSGEKETQVTLTVDLTEEGKQ